MPFPSLRLSAYIRPNRESSKPLLSFASPNMHGQRSLLRPVMHGDRRSVRQRADIATCCYVGLVLG